ncbi:MAG TPA: beta-galactosidase, partial [Phycisphaeraceae bacterium]
RSASDDEPIQTAAVPLGVAPLAEPRPVEPDSPFGVVAHLNRMSDAEREHTVQLMARAGVRWAREGFLWDAIEPAEGQFDWATYDHLVDTCQRYGISVLPVLAYGTTWAASDPEHGGSAAGRTTAPRLDAWRRYVEAVARRYGDRIRVWEVWNEPNSTTFFRPAPGMSRADSYAQLLAAAYETLKRVDPEAKVMIGGFTPKHWLPDQPHLHEATFMEAIYRQQPVPFDILGYHPYTAPHTETTNRASVEKYLRLPGPCWEAMRAHGEEGKPTWMTEMGTPTMSFMSADRAAEYLVVLYVTGMADPRIEKNFWYDFRDDGTDPKNKEHHFGLLRHDGAPKPGYLAYYTLTRLLEGAAFVDRQEHDGAAIHRFQTPDGQVLVVWAQGDESASLTLETGGSSAQVLGVTGGPVDFEQEAGVLKLTATPSPTFVILH